MPHWRPQFSMAARDANLTLQSHVRRLSSPQTCCAVELSKNDGKHCEYANYEKREKSKETLTSSNTL